MQLITNFDPALTSISVLYYVFNNVKLIYEIPDYEAAKTTPEKTVIVTSGFSNNPILRLEVENLLVYRIQNNLPTRVIFDFSFEYHLLDADIDKLSLYFINLGLDVEKNLLILNNNNYNSTIQERSYTHTYNIWFVDGYFWLNYKPEKFTNLSLVKRPQLFNLILSKLTTKKSRIKIAYKFYKKNLLNRCMLSVMGNLQEFAAVVDDRDFLEEIDQRITNIGGSPVKYQEGISNTEFMCETSNRTIFNNSILSCVLETAFSIEVNGITEWAGNGCLTEKFFRCIVNKTPFIVYGSPGVYQFIKNMGFDDFGSIVDLSFDLISEEKLKIEMYTEQVEKFLDNFPTRKDEIQAICDHNYDVFLNRAEAEYKYYQDRITNFLN